MKNLWTHITSTFGWKSYLCDLVTLYGLLTLARVLGVEGSFEQIFFTITVMIVIFTLDRPDRNK